MAKPAQPLKSNYVAATLYLTVTPPNSELPPAPVFYPVQLKFDSTNLRDVVERSSAWVEKQTKFPKVKFDNASPKNKPFTNKGGEIDRHIIVCEGDANPEWVLADNIMVIYAKHCNCGMNQGTCVKGTGDCMEGTLEGESHE